MQVKQRETEAAERATLVRQEKLVLAKGKIWRLTNLMVKPAFGGRGKKVAGVLECHGNGFRYSTSKSDERLDIIFSNIKHAFFQPSKRELVTLIHFHLHDPIMACALPSLHPPSFIEMGVNFRLRSSHSHHFSSVSEGRKEEN